MDAVNWDYRVVRRKEPDGTEIYSICEAYSDRNSKIFALSQVSPMGDTIDDLKHDMAWMVEALKKPVLDAGSIPEQGAINEIKEALKGITPTVAGSEAGGSDSWEWNEPLNRGNMKDVLDELDATCDQILAKHRRKP